jgi:hypothetical protein
VRNSSNSIKVLLFRERVDEVTEVELKDDEKFALELRFNDGAANLQLSFDTQNEMLQWRKAISLILSSAIVSPTSNSFLFPSFQQDELVPVACAMILTDTTVLFAQEGANCLVDGFMRLLLQVTFRDISSIGALNTIRHHLLILRRESGASEVIFLRNEMELQRLCASFTSRWGSNVDDLTESTAQNDAAYSRVYRQCCQMNDVWSMKSEDE